MNVSIGSTGSDVIAVQTMLRNLGWNNINIDGKYGPITQQAVSDFQWLSGLSGTGVVDDVTWATMQSQYGSMIVSGGTPVLQPTPLLPTANTTNGTPTTIPTVNPVVVQSNVTPPMDTTLMIGIGLASLTLLMVARKNGII